MQAAVSFGKRKAAPAQFAPAVAKRPSAPEPVSFPTAEAEFNDTYDDFVAPSTSRMGVPYLTLGLILVLALIYWAEAYVSFQQGRGSTPGVVTLAAFGGLNGAAVDGGQVWRFFTAPLLHGSLSHLVGNAVALFFAGLILEKLIGPAWFAALFVISALGGAAGSLAFNPGNVVSVGASGAIVGLLAAAFVCSFLFESEQLRRRMQKISVRFLAPSLLPALLPLSGGSTTHVDYGAHIGGAIAGAVVGFILSEIWPESSAKPPLRRFAFWIAIIGVVGASIGFLVTALTLPAYAVHKEILIPESEYPSTSDDAVGRSAALVERYPRDPRARLARATYFLGKHDLVDAERQLRLGLDEGDVLAALPTDVKHSLQMVLAVVLVYEGRKPEAKTLAKPFCGGSFPSEFRKLYDILETEGVCA